jgi:hypothetical protein
MNCTCLNLSSCIHDGGGDDDDDDNLHWVQALMVPMHLGLIDGPFVPHNLISTQESHVPLPRFQMAPKLKILMSSGSKKGTQT